MAKQTINVGTNQDDGTGDLLRVAFQKINSNFTELYTEIGGDSLSNLNFSGSTISTDNSNSNLILDPNGTGLVQITGDLTVTGDATVQTDLAVTGNTALNGTLTVTGVTTLGTLVITSVSAGSGTYTGNLTVQGNTDLQGNVDIGDSTVDTITVTGRFDSSLVPSITETNDIGSSSLRWRDIYAQDGNFSGNIDVTGNVTIGGNITIGDATTDSITITADLTSDIIPNASSTYDIGAIGKTWQNVYADGFTGNLTGNVTGDVTSSGTSTFATIDVNTAMTVGTSVTLDASTTFDAGANKLTNLLDPTSNQDAATKAYVDAQVVAGATWTLVDDTSTATIISSGENLAILGGSGISTATTTDTLTISSSDTLATVTGRGSSTGTAVNFTGGATASQLTVDSITINDNNITTNTTNADLVLIPAGTGVVRVDTSILPAASGTYDLGSASLRWRDLYLSGSSLNLGGVELTNNSGTLEWNGSPVIGLANVVEDTTPQLGGNLDAQTFNITNLGTLNTHTIPGGTGTLALTSDITFTASSTDTLTNKSGNISQWTNDSGYLTSALANVVEDTTPQLGGSLDLNGNNITGTGDINITGAITLSGNLTVNGTTTTVNSTEVTIQNAFVFEGATDDGFETTLTVVDPTADRTITLPDTSGTVALTSDITFTASSTDTLTNKSGNISQWTNDSGYLTSETSHADVLVDGDFASAGIMATDGSGTYSIITNNSSTWDTALQNIVEDTTPQLGGGLDLNSNDITGTGNINITGTAETSGNVTVGRTLNVTGFGGYGIIIQNNQSVSWYDSTDTYLTQLEATDATNNRTITLPDASGTVALTSDITFTASSTDTLTNKSGNISQWTNDSGYLTSVSASGNNTEVQFNNSGAFAGDSGLTFDSSGGKTLKVGAGGGTVKANSFQGADSVSNGVIFQSDNGSGVKASHLQIQSHTGSVQTVFTSGAVDFTGATSVDFTGTTVTGLALSVADMAAAAVVTVAETLAANDVDTAFVTAGAIIDYVGDNRSFNLAGNTGTGAVDVNGGESLVVIGTTGQINSSIAANYVSLSLDSNINSIQSIAFEGSTDDANEITLTSADPSADRTVTLADLSGHVALFDVAPTATITATPAELNYMDGVTSNVQTQLDSKTSYSNSDVDAHLNQSNPTDGYVLSWTSGDYAWVAQSGGSSQWTTTGSDIYYNTGNVGIGNTGPSYKLEVTSSDDVMARFDGSGKANTGSVEIDILGPQSNGDIQMGIGGSGINDATNNIDNKGFIASGATLDGLNLRADNGFVQITAGGITSSDEVARFSSGAVTISGTLNTHTIPGGTGTLALTSDITLSTLSVTSTAAELNVLDGIPGTLTATELGYVDGVTSAIQTQIDGKASLSGATFTGDVIFNTGVEEAFDTLTGSTGTVTHDCDNGHIFYHTTPSANWTANFTNLGLTAEYGTSLTIIVNQGATAYLPTAMQIGGVAQTINWQGGLSPTGTDNGIDVVSFTVLNDGGTYLVLGQMVDFG